MGDISIREYIRWLPGPPSEPTSTIVLTSPERRFVDLRILREPEPSADGLSFTLIHCISHKSLIILRYFPSSRLLPNEYVPSVLESPRLNLYRFPPPILPRLGHSRNLFLHPHPFLFPHSLQMDTLDRLPPPLKSRILLRRRRHVPATRRNRPRAR
jgi:hypothetical protein